MTDFDDKLKSLNQKINSNKAKHVLVENELKKLQTFDTIYFRGKNHFDEDGTQNYLVFQLMQRHFKRVSGVGTGNYIYLWKSKELSGENITAPASYYSLNSQLNYLGNKTRVEFKGSCLKQDKITHDHVKIVNVYIVYKISKNFNINSYPTLENCLFDEVSLIKHVDIDKYKYLNMELDLIDMSFFHTLVVASVEM